MPTVPGGMSARFSVFSSLPRPVPVLLAAALAFILLVGFAPLRAPPARDIAFLRPPLRGPPSLIV